MTNSTKRTLTLAALASVALLSQTVLAATASYFASAPSFPAPITIRNCASHVSVPAPSGHPMSGSQITNVSYTYGLSYPIPSGIQTYLCRGTMQTTCSTNGDTNCLNVTSIGSGSASDFNGQTASGFYFLFYVPGTGSFFPGVGFTNATVTVSYKYPTAPSAVTTNAATNVTSTTVGLNGSANPELASTTGFFRASSTNPGTCNNSFGTRFPEEGGRALGSGSASVTYSLDLSGGDPNTTTYYCALASNAYGTRWGSVQSFTTLPAVPTTKTPVMTPTSVQLSGQATASGGTVTTYFRVYNTNPGTCNDTTGTRVPASGGTVITGSSPVDFSQPLTTTAVTTYYYCAISTNAQGGKSLGAVVEFKTPFPISALLGILND